MVAVPSGVIFINNDLVNNTKNYIAKQFHIDEVMDGYVFDDKITADPDYVSKVKQLNLRIMVVRSFIDEVNRDQADLVVFYKEGMLTALKNNFGPPTISVRADHAHWGQFCIF